MCHPTTKSKSTTNLSDPDLKMLQVLVEIKVDTTIFLEVFPINVVKSLDQLSQHYDQNVL